MNEFLITALVFTTLVSAFLLILFGWSWYELGGYEKAKDHWKRKKLFRDMKPLLYVPHAIIATAAILAFMVASTKAGASDYSYFNYIQVNAGLEYQVGERHYNTCIDVEGSNLDKVGSNLGVTVNALKTTLWVFDLEVNGTYTHHSCAVESDFKVSDSIGLQTIWRINLKR